MESATSDLGLDDDIIVPEGGADDASLHRAELEDAPEDAPGDTSDEADAEADAPDAGTAAALAEDVPSAEDSGDELPAEAAPAPRKRRTIQGPGSVRSRGRRDRAADAGPVSIDALVEAARKSLDDDKAEDIVVLDVTGRADYADRLVIASGLADRQIQAMAQHLEEALEQAGLRRRLRFEGLGSSDWVLVDAGDLWIHLFKPDARQAYGLERMWGPDSPSAENVVLVSQSEPAAEPPREQSDGEE